MPMTGWAVRPIVARSIVICGTLLFVVSLVSLGWDYRTSITKPIEAIQSALNLPTVRSFLIQGSLLLALLIVLLLILFRPLSRQIQEMRRLLDRYVVPRHLTEEQIDTIAGHLREYPPGRVVLRFPGHDSETAAFRGDFGRALRQGGWEVSHEISDEGREGISMYLQRPPNDGQRSNTDIEKSRDVLKGAIQKAGVHLEGDGSGGTKPGEEAKLILTIGPRRMDDGFERMRQRKLEAAGRFLRSGGQEGGDFD